MTAPSASQVSGDQFAYGASTVTLNKVTQSASNLYSS